MACVSTYFNFLCDTEEDLPFCRSVFGRGFKGPIHRWGQNPVAPGQPQIPGARATERAS